MIPKCEKIKRKVTTDRDFLRLRFTFITDGKLGKIVLFWYISVFKLAWYYRYLFRTIFSSSLVFVKVV